ncbi:MAG: carboxypeptidase regulatory-like domain-containing protein [Armatimonadetes bacterium]|nr:carboxypeptidase regulatory-like domain-containing protein [Armatimonadota bacterium]
MIRLGVGVGVGVWFVVPAAVLFALAGVADAGVRPDADQVAAALSNYGSKWLTEHGQTGHSTHFATQIEPGQSRWEGDAYVCRFEGASIPNAPGATEGSLFTGELWVYFDPDTGALRCTPKGTSLQHGVPMTVAELRARFPDGAPGTVSQNWTQLLHLSLSSEERPYHPDNPLGPTQTGTFAVPAAGGIRITYSWLVHADSNMGGLEWDLGKGPTRDWPGIGGTMLSRPDPLPGPGGMRTWQTDGWRVDPMERVTATLTPRGMKAGFALGTMGTQLADRQELTVEFCPDAGASAPGPVATTGTAEPPPTQAPEPKVEVLPPVTIIGIVGMNGRVELVSGAAVSLVYLPTKVVYRMPEWKTGEFGTFRIVADHRLPGGGLPPGEYEVLVQKRSGDAGSDPLVVGAEDDLWPIKRYVISVTKEAAAAGDIPAPLIEMDYVKNIDFNRREGSLSRIEDR